MLGYMITWTTYGTWLQGDKRGYVKNSEILQPNLMLEKLNREKQLKESVWFSKEYRSIVKAAIIKEAAILEQKIYAISISANHVHIVAENHSSRIETLVAKYKNAARQALYKVGLRGKVWTRGYDKRYCFNQSELKSRIEYVQRHNED